MGQKETNDAISSAYGAFNCMGTNPHCEFVITLDSWRNLSTAFSVLP